jgi:nucleoside 2-deoxyribosyltransferase
MNRPLVYLAGPIAGLTYDEAIDWRDEAKRLLAPEVAGLSPLRAKDFLRGTGVIGTTPYDHVLSSDKGIVARDRSDALRSDLILANFLDAPRSSIGTAVEFGWADAFRKPIVAVITPGSAHDHPFLRQLAGWVVETLSDACALARTILLPE